MTEPHLAGVDFAPVQSPDLGRARNVSRLLARSVPGRNLGRLADIGAWVAGVQGASTPAPFAHPRAVIVAARHGVAQRGVSAWEPDAGATLLEQLEAGAGPAHIAARAAGASVRVVDDFDEVTGAIDVEPAMTAQQCAAAIARGMEVADHEVDSGTDLIIPGNMGVGDTTVAAAVYGTLTRTEPVKAIGRGSGINDEVWKVKVAAIRDAMFRARTIADDVERVLAEISGPDMAFLVGLVAQSAARRTPVLIDAALPSVAAYAAERLAPGTKRWCIAGGVSPEPAHIGCLQALELTPVLALDMTTGQAAGALAALPQVNMAAEMAAEALTQLRATSRPEPR